MHRSLPLVASQGVQSEC